MMSVSLHAKRQDGLEVWSGTYLVDETVYTLPQGVPAQSLILCTCLVFRRLGLHRPQP